MLSITSKVLMSLMSLCGDTFLSVAGQTTLLEVLMGIGNGLRPGISEEFIPSNLPQRNTLLHFITLCWHQEPDYRPHTAGNVQGWLSLQGLYLRWSRWEHCSGTPNQ